VERDTRLFARYTERSASERIDERPIFHAHDTNEDKYEREREHEHEH
jgi:hypothetical protein